MSYTHEIAISTNRRVRMHLVNFWYRIDVSHVRGRWTRVSGTRDRALAEKLFVRECDYTNRVYPTAIV